ncbi:hypothetical protein IAT38_000500 [Cryptococcus sp. DSM 104549]
MAQEQQPDIDAIAAELEGVIEQLEDQPDNVAVLRRQILLTSQVGMAAEALDAYAKLSSLIMLSEEQWFAYLEATMASVESPMTLDGFIAVHDIFERAESDYISLPILLRHSQFILSCFNAAQPSSASEDQPAFPVDSELAEYFSSPETTQKYLGDLLEKGKGVLNESQQLWQPLIDWETGLQAQIDRIHDLYLDRLATPHATMDNTKSTYSSFCSQYCNEEYEARLVQATEVSKTAKIKLSEEKRFGKTRDDFELQLLYTTDIASQAPILIEYTKWEADQRTKPGAQGKAPSTDPELTQSVFERAVVPYAKLAAQYQASLDEVNVAIKALEKKIKAKGKGKGKKKGEEEEEDPAAQKEALVQQKTAAEDSIRAYKDAEAGIWARYARWESRELANDSSENLDQIFEKGLALGLLFVPEGRTQDMVELAAKVNKAGDSSLKLEKFLLDWAETKAPEYLDQALLVLDKPHKSRNSSYQFTILRTAVEVRRGDEDSARELFTNAIHRSDLDWPEAVYEAFIQFETIHGTLETLSKTKKKIEVAQEKLAKRREKEAQEAQAYQEMYAAQVAITGDAPVPAAAEVPAALVAEAEAMDVDPKEDASAPAASAPAAVAAPKAAASDEIHIKRDREHTTVLVSGLPKGIDARRVEQFFAECGAIRETTVLRNDGNTHDSALVEFKSADSIPEVLAKDQRQFSGSPVSVSMLWRSTLFVTNFPRDEDDTGIRKLFGQYGRILETRWPSRKYADSRRFVYITMDSPAAAQEALVLHGYKIPGGHNFGLTVLISDPSAKTKRSDETKSTLFLGGLGATSTELDVRGLLKKYGYIRHVKLGWDPVNKVCKGFAFVEMGTEPEAQAALALHGTRWKSKKLKVEISDPNHVNKKPANRNSDEAAEKRLRSVRLSNLPENTQEGLLQQALEKLVPVKRLEMFAKSHEAVAELESQADVGKLLLRTEPWNFNGNDIIFTEKNTRPPPRQAQPAPVASASGSTTSTPAPAESASAPPPGPPPSMFAPRSTQRSVIGKARPAKVIASSAVFNKDKAANQSQEDFRSFMYQRSQERVEKREAAEKRKAAGAVEGEEKEVKKPRIDGAEEGAGAGGA